MLQILMKLAIAALHFLMAWVLKLSVEFSQTSGYLISSLLRIKSPATSIELITYYSSLSYLLI